MSKTNRLKQTIFASLLYVMAVISVGLFPEIQTPGIECVEKTNEYSY